MTVFQNSWDTNPYTLLTKYRLFKSKKRVVHILTIVVYELKRMYIN